MEYSVKQTGLKGINSPKDKNLRMNIIFRNSDENVSRSSVLKANCDLLEFN